MKIIFGFAKDFDIPGKFLPCFCCDHMSMVYLSYVSTVLEKFWSGEKWQIRQKEIHSPILK